MNDQDLAELIHDLDQAHAIAAQPLRPVSSPGEASAGVIAGLLAGMVFAGAPGRR